MDRCLGRGHRRGQLTDDAELVMELVSDVVVRNGEADRLRNGMPSGVFDREEEPIAQKGKESKRRMIGAVVTSFGGRGAGNVTASI